LDDFTLYLSRIFPWRESENLRKLGQERITGKIRSHYRNYDLPLFKSVSKLALHARTCCGIEDREDTVSAIYRILNGRGSRRGCGGVIRDVHLDAVGRRQRLQT